MTLTWWGFFIIQVSTLLEHLGRGVQPAPASLSAAAQEATLSTFLIRPVRKHP